MSTIIYPSPIFGPIQSRRLGVSLGVNLMPDDGKLCTFNCIYCECGLNEDFKPSHKRPTREEVRTALSATLKERHEAGLPLDVITFAGNGEPTGHPDFAAIIDDTIALRDTYFPDAKVSVLSNATLLDREGVMDALRKVDNNIQKLDTVNQEYIRKVDCPTMPGYDVRRVIDNLKAFDGKVIIQTMFMGAPYDNTTPEYVNPWLEAVREISPSQVMIYTIDRETPVKGLTKASRETLDSIKELLTKQNILCTASY